MTKPRKPERARPDIAPAPGARPGFENVTKVGPQHLPSVPKSKTRPASKGRVHKGRTRS